MFVNNNGNLNVVNFHIKYKNNYLNIQKFIFFREGKLLYKLKLYFSQFKRK